MILVKKDGRFMAVRDANQLAAFLNNGWEEAKDNTEVKAVNEPESESLSEVKEPSDEVKWTKDEIDKMPFMKLKSIAKKNGIDVDDKKAAEIRAELIEKLGV